MGKSFKYASVIALIGMVLTLFLIINVVKVQKSNKKVFYDSGYILKDVQSSEQNKREIKGFVEIEYVDNEIVRIYNQEAKYQTISSKAYIEMPENIRIMLGNNVISKNSDIKMSLENMVIDSEDNAEVVDLEKNKEELISTSTTKPTSYDVKNSSIKATSENKNSCGVYNANYAERISAKEIKIENSS